MRKANCIIHVMALVVLAAGGVDLHAAPADPSGGTGGDPLSGTLTVTVVASGTTDPIAGAFVMVGPAPGVPFQNNTGVTNQLGRITFTNNSIQAPSIVTAGAAGSSYVTVFGLGVSEVVLPLASIAPGPTARIGDQFTVDTSDGMMCSGNGSLDLGIVFPAVTVDQMLEGYLLDGLSVNEDTATTSWGDVEVPSNLYLPAQCELFNTFEKASYHLRVPQGRRTLFGLTARGSLFGVLRSESLLDLLQALSFRDVDILRDQLIGADSDDFDLDSSVPLDENLTLDVANGQPGTEVIAAAVGRITSALGDEELIATGFDGYDPDVDGSDRSLTLETVVAGGVFGDLVHGAAVTQLRDVAVMGSNFGSTTAFVRSGFTPPATLTFDSFYDIVWIDSPNNAQFVWTDVTSPTSPADRDLNVSRLIHVRQIANPDDSELAAFDLQTYWTLYTRGSETGLTLPTLPPGAPTALPDPSLTQEQDRMDFRHTVRLLGDDPTGFDFDAFAFADTARFGTHVSMNQRPLRCSSRSEITGLRLDRGPTPGEVTLTWNPSTDVCHEPFGRSYEVYSGNTVAPASAPGSFPNDPAFEKITDEDTDASMTNPAFTHLLPVEDLVLYLVVDRGLTGNEAQAGHYGSN